MTETAGQSAEPGVIEVYAEAAEHPVAGGQWEILADDTVRYIRPDGKIEQPAIVPADTLRTSPTWHQVR